MRRPDWPAIVIAALAIVSTSAASASAGPCAADAAKLCPGATSPKSIEECLRLEIVKVSADCTKWLLHIAVSSANAAGPCREDVPRLCKEIAAGDGRLRDCLQQHAAELSPSCATAIGPHAANGDAQAANGGGPCTTGAQKFCSGVEKGNGALRACLVGHEKELSPACNLAIGNGPLNKMGTACGDDLQRLCAGTTSGKGDLQACLKKHDAELTPDCRALVGGK